jgi:hypothetical protein
VKSKRGSGMGREGASEALEPEKRGRGGVHGHCYGGGEVAGGRASGQRGTRERGPGRRS